MATLAAPLTGANVTPGAAGGAELGASGCPPCVTGAALAWPDLSALHAALAHNPAAPAAAANTVRLRTINILPARTVVISAEIASPHLAGVGGDGSGTAAGERGERTNVFTVDLLRYVGGLNWFTSRNGGGAYDRSLAGRRSHRGAAAEWFESSRDGPRSGH